jgi:hypothetical protein
MKMYYAYSWPPLYLLNIAKIWLLMHLALSSSVMSLVDFVAFSHEKSFVAIVTADACLHWWHVLQFKDMRLPQTPNRYLRERWCKVWHLPYVCI